MWLLEFLGPYVFHDVEKAERSTEFSLYTTEFGEFWMNKSKAELYTSIKK